MTSTPPDTSKGVTEAMVEAAVTAALKADIIPLKEGYPGVRLEDYIEMPTSGDAIELGVTLTAKDADGKPRFHWLDYCRADEMDDFHRAILRPVIRAALAALSPLPAPEPTEGIAEQPISRMSADDGRPMWEQISDLIKFHMNERPPIRLRDELVTILAWARYGEQADAALTALQAERDTQDAAIKLLSHSNDSHLEELGRVIMACPQGMRTSPASDGVKQLRAAFDRLQAGRAALSSKESELE